MIRLNYTKTNTASAGRAKTRLNAATAIGGAGVLAGLCVAAWGSFFAVHGLYPSYVEAFLSEDAKGATETAAMTRDVLPAVTAPETAAPETELVVVADRPAETPVKPEVPVQTLPDTPAKIGELSFEDFAALGQETVGLGSATSQPTENAVETAAVSQIPSLQDSAAAVPDTDPLAGIDPELLRGRMGSAPLEGDSLVTRVVASATSVVQTVRPAPRPAGFAPVREPARDMAPEAEIISSMNGATELAVDISPRPRAIPDDLRTALTAPGAVARLETVAANPASDPAPRGSAVLAGNGCNRSLANAMPGRRGNATGGQAFVSALGNGSGSSRDNAIINELAKGNMPDFLHDLQPVVLSGKDSRGSTTQIVICVTPDYLALGSDRDFVRVPLGLPAAASIANRFNMTLPTSRMVDAIYAQASVRLSPSPMQPGPQMSSTDYFLRHNATIEGQRGGRAGLVSGHKKDVVLANRMASNPGRVAIYGWHRSKNDPIQPVSTVHGASYADYSHGIRLVSRTAFVNGKPVDIDDLLSSDRYAYLLNADGPMPGGVIQLASR
ncbi:hypothetical protein [Maritimibacter sp. DP1N21-5]|uniref:hypothetical protein n=1 Tax=Maritimibacter sp. DP1N21-5 TaxID=2836867 RepID=UPI001C44E58C|nr:hypothetical protein [Maritimibacter sp. DP1N21-5]MBV7408419.1 hypothetical protein [Maritimibacter sp. DP1N21-5]